MQNNLNNVEERDFYFLEETNPEKAEEKVVNLYCEKIPEKFGFDPFSEIQVISPLYKGKAGVTRLNKILQKILNPKGHFLLRGQTVFRVGDKVMQLKNNYEKEVFNGDIGIIEQVNSGKEEILVRFPEKSAVYRGQELNQLTLSYAVSVHKSQGSEYPAIIMPIIISHYIMLQRNLLYTALTRAKKLAILVGEKKALFIAIKNNKAIKRYTKLAERLAKKARENIDIR